MIRAPDSTIRISALACHGLIVGLTLLAISSLSAAPKFCVNYSLHPNLEELKHYDISILNPDAKVDVHSLVRSAHRPFAYLSVVEVASDAPYRDELATRQIPLLGKNKEWNSDFADISNPAWTIFVVDYLAAEAVNKGYRGFFLDTVDSVEHIERANPGAGTRYREGMISLIKTLKAKFPQMPIIMNRGFPILPDLAETVDGVLVESLLRKYDFATKTYIPVEPSGTEWLLGILNKIKLAKLDIYIVDYVDPSDRATAMETAKRIEELGFLPFVSTVELDGKFLNRPAADETTPPGAREFPRKIMVIFGNSDSNREFKVIWPIDSAASRFFQAPLQWLGYQLEFHNPLEKPDYPQLDESFHGIIVDRSLTVPPDKEAAFADWLIAQKQAGKKILFFGEIRISDPDILNRVLREFGFSGTGEYIQGVTGLKITRSAPQMNYETKVIATPADFRDIRAPMGAEVLCSVQGGSPRDEKIYQFDPVFLCSWGAFLSDPFALFMRPDEDELWMVDPFYILENWTGRRTFPSPDATTRDGVRIFFAHIDGDGFRHKSTVEPNRRSGEILFKHIVQKYPLPITCSIIEAETAAIIDKQDPTDRLLLTELAREVFALEKVEVGSHTYSHPFFWKENDRGENIYDQQKLLLRPALVEPGVNYHREVVGSINYIRRELIPDWKSVEIMLWSGNCRPWPEALRYCRELGVENMNGGDTAMTRKNPSLTRVSGHSVPWGDEIQIFCAHQNENVYRFRWKGGSGPDSVFLGGFILALDSFKLTESPRRLKPVNIYYHWYSGDNLISFSPLKQLYEWSMKQELHAITAAPFARLVRDLRNTRVYQKSPSQWILKNDGFCRTFRMNKSALVPDIATSKGVTGWREYLDSIYIHTDGSPTVELNLSPQPPAHVYLQSSTAEIRMMDLTKTSAYFYAKDYRPCNVTLAGFSPKQNVTITVNGKPMAWAADAAGILAMELPQEALVRVTAQ